VTCEREQRNFGFVTALRCSHLNITTTANAELRPRIERRRRRAEVSLAGTGLEKAAVGRPPPPPSREVQTSQLNSRRAVRNGVHAQGDSSSKTTTARPPYRKVLFLRQPYPDNHVDASFLRDLKRNGASPASLFATTMTHGKTLCPVNVHPANLPALLRQTLPITQHVASIFIFVVVFIRLSRASLSASALLTLCAVLSGTLRAWAWAIGEPTAWAGVTASLMTAARAPLPSTAQNGNGPCCTGDETAPRLRPVDTTASASTSPVGTLIPLVALYLLSPALKTLTRATTSDSIWALSGTLFAINVLLGDYRAIPTSSSFRRDLVPRLFSHASKKPTLSAPERAPHRAPYFARRAPLPSTLSLTAALSGSTVLASRLPSNAQVFSLLLFSTLWFGPFPLLRSSLTLRPTLILTYCLSAIALVGLFRTVGTGGTVLASAILLGTSVVAPLVRGWLHVRYKDRLSGPWDVVPPKVNNNGHDQHFDFLSMVNGDRLDTAKHRGVS
jgi:phosphatidylinositol glycan class C protein